MKPVLDATCGSRMIWFNKDNDLAIFCDKRELDNEAIWTSGNGKAKRYVSIHPDVIADFIFGLSSEAGEVSGIMQKTYQGHRIDRDNMIKELGDCMWMIAEIATAMDVTLEHIAQANIDKLRKRYPDGFTEERSINREEYQHERETDPSHTES